MARGGSQASSHRSDGGKGEVKGRLSVDASMDKAKLVELENQYTQLYVGEMCSWRDGGREGREPVHTAVCWRDVGREGGENQYTQLYVGGMEEERGERTSTHSCMLERWRERGGREPVHTAVCWRDGGREGERSCMLERWRERGLYVGEMEGERDGGERTSTHSCMLERQGT